MTKFSSEQDIKNYCNEIENSYIESFRDFSLGTTI